MTQASLEKAKAILRFASYPAALCISLLITPRASAQATIQQSSTQKPWVETHKAMGTLFTLYLYAPSEQKAHALAESAFEEVDRVDSLLSNYKPTSELSRINREAANTAVITDPETFAFLQTSLQWSARTNGAFDITVGSLMKAWGFFRAQGRVPTSADLATVRQQTGWEKVQLDPATRSVHFTAPGLELDPGGIGKGYVVDRLVTLLRAQHVESALISAGTSTIYAIGSPPGTDGWKVEVPDPENKGVALSQLTLRDTSLSTSACTEKFFILAGHTYCHLMNPHTLQPVDNMVQTTVIDPSATDSDALSASLFVLGAEGSRQLAAKMPRVDALVLTGHGDVDGCITIRWPGSLQGHTCK
jgi:thiamine biosynthesis lipoprotein